MIIIRTAHIDPNLERIAFDMARASGDKVAFAIDERRGEIASVVDKVSITSQNVECLKIYAPENFAWMCGDYCLYLARHFFPDERYFWLIENDVRISGDASQFFAVMNERKEDVLCVHLRVAERNWWWYKTALGLNVKPHRSLFPIGRYSSRSIDYLREKRQRHSSSFNRRMLWPNDEAFVATSITNSSFSIGDINSGVRQFYTNETLNFEGIKKEGNLPADLNAPPQIFHPVLSGAQIEKKMLRNAGANIRQSRIAAIKRLGISYLNSITRW